MRKKSNTNFKAEQPRQGWAFFEESNQWRRTPHSWGAPGDHFPREFGGWFAVSKPLGWQPPAGTLAGESLLDAGGASLRMFAPAVDGAGAGGGHTKIGAGHKPQGYDEHGRYTGPSGGSIPTGGGPVRLYANEADETPDEEEQAGEDSGGEPDEAAPAAEGATQELEGVLVADSGRVATDAGGGLSGGTEVRGPVTPPQKQPAEVTWKNDEPKPDPSNEDLRQPMQKTVEGMKTEVPKLETVNINSGRRPGDPETSKDPHVQGRAVDINNINGVRVVNLPTATGPKGEQAREAAANLEDWAKKTRTSRRLLGPPGGGREMRKVK